MTLQPKTTLSEDLLELQNSNPGKYYQFQIKKELFDKDAEKLWDRGNEDGQEIWKFIYVKIKQFKLSEAYDVCDILSLSYTRSIKALVAGKVIYAVKPWMKSTSYNVIRELRRERDKENIDRSDPQEVLDLFIDIPIDDEENSISNRAKTLSKCLIELTEFEIQILNLGADKSVSWKNALIILKKQGFSPKSESALRKAYQRVKEKLKTYISD